MRNAPYMKRTWSGAVFDIFNVVFMLLFTIVMLYPFWNQFVLSFNEGTDAVRGGIFLLPRKLDFGNYAYAFASRGMVSSVITSVMRVVVGAGANLFCCGLLAFVVANKNFSGRRIMRFIVVLTMYIPMGLIPLYVLYNALGMLNTFTVYWLPHLITGWNVLMITSYISNQPDSLFETARLDGAGEIRIFIRIVMPLCVPVLAALAVITSVYHWNSWYDNLVYNPSGDFDTLQMLLRRNLINADIARDLMATNSSVSIEEAMKLQPVTIRAATTMIVTIPIICVYPFLQRYFISGISIGAVKG